MHYPWWHVPLLTSPMLIALIAVVHVLVAHYAVGGGLFLAFETRHAYRTGNLAYLAYLKRHARFFILLTVVFGAITGVGIWWIIGLASPLATETLIHGFVFGWAMEYVFFIVEILAAFIFYYFWGRLQPRTHQFMGWIYAVSAWMSLVLITGITAFMLNPGDWPENQSFWVGFFNPQFLPQTLARTGGSLLLASLYVYLHATFKAETQALRDLIAKRSARPALVGALMLIVSGVTWYVFLPESARIALETASVLNVLTALLFALTVAVFAMLYLGPYRNPGWLTPGFAILFFVMGLAAMTTGEYVREAVRKPYVIYNVVFGNQVYPEELARFRTDGYLESGVWTRQWVEINHPEAMHGQTVNEAALLALPEAERAGVGEVLFQYHCNMCHAGSAGFSAMGHLTRGWTREMLNDLVRNPNAYHFFMPPWAGTDEETVLLTDYLLSTQNPPPEGMRLSGELEESAQGGRP